MYTYFNITLHIINVYLSIQSKELPDYGGKFYAEDTGVGG